MNGDFLKHFATYYSIYKYVASGSKTLEEIKAFLESENVPRSTINNQMKMLEEGKNLGFLRINGDMVVVKREEALELIHEINEGFGLLIGNGNSVEQEICKQQEEIKKLTTELEKLKKQKKTDISIKKNQITAAKKLYPKVLLIDSITVGESEDMGIMLTESKGSDAIDLKEYVRKHGIERDSFYMELPEELELSKQNQRKKTFANVFTENRLLSRLRELRMIQRATGAKAHKIENTNRLNLSNKQVSLQESFLMGRALSIQEILADDKLSNQEKLALYAFNSPYRRTDMEKLLNIAGDECVDANWLITLLESPDLCCNYENVRDLIRQCAKPSEWKMKQRLAQELIEGKWFITADYDGKSTKFQLVPVEELNEIKGMLNISPRKSGEQKDNTVNKKAAVKPAKKKSVAKPTEPKPEDAEIEKPLDIPTDTEAEDEILPDEVNNYGERGASDGAKD